MTKKNNTTNANANATPNTGKKYMPAIENAIAHYGHEKDKLPAILQGEKALAGALWLALDSDVKGLKATRDNAQKKLSKQDITKTEKDKAKITIADCDEKLAEKEPLFAGLDIMKATGIFDIANEIAVYQHGIGACSYLYHADHDAIMAFVDKLNEYGVQHHENLNKLIAGGKVCDKDFYAKVTGDIQTAIVMLCPTANISLKNKHVVDILGMLVTKKDGKDKNLNATAKYSYAKTETLCKKICALIAQKMVNFDVELGAYVKPTKDNAEQAQAEAEQK